MSDLKVNNKDIAIIGMSCFAPDAKDVGEYWTNLVNGVDSIKEAPADRIDQRYFDSKNPGIDRFYCKRGGFIPDIPFDPVPFSILPVAVEGMDTAHLLALKSVRYALEDAGVFEKNISLNKCALVIGRGAYVGSAVWRALDIVHVGEQVAEIVKMALPGLSDEEVNKIKKAYQATRGRYQADSMPGLIPNLIASLISNKLDMHGPAYVIDAACASSLIALEHCVNEIHSGRCDIAIAGGVHAGHNAAFWSIFSQLGALSYKQQIAPFSEDADGLLIGEGGGFIVIKSLEKAIADKDRIYAVIKGIGVSSDGSGMAVMAPSSKGQKLAIENAWSKTNLDRKKVGYIEAHGTATIVGDRTELQTLSAIFPKELGDSEILLGSVKSNIGHAMPAAGILSLIKTSLALYTRQIPATLHCERPLKEMSETRFRPVQKLQEWDESKYPLVAGVNAFGFGGINAHVILEAYGERKTYIEAAKTKMEKVFAFAAPTKEALIKALKEGAPMTGNEEGDHRLVLFNPTPDRISKAIKFIEKDLIWKGRQDIWYTNKPLLKDGGKVGFLFPGYDPDINPEIDSILNYFNYSLPEDKTDINEMIDKVLELYRVNKALTMSLRDLGITADLNAGHSLGEWFGIEASGMVSSESVRKIITTMDADKYRIEGTCFIAVGCGVERVKKYIDSISDLYLSNDNCPSQVLLCGTDDAAEKLAAELKEEQIFYQVLSFQSGFHTPFIKHRLDLLEVLFRHLEFSKPEVPMWSANSLDVYPTNTKEIEILSVNHLIEGVRFRELIEKLHEQENTRVFIQVGGGSLTGFVDDTLAGKDYSAISMVTNQRTTLEQIRRVMALLHIEGRQVKMSFLNVANLKLSAEVPQREMKLQMYMEVLNKLPLLSQYAQKYKQPSNVDLNSLSLDTDNPILSALNENFKEMVSLQTEMTELFKKRVSGNNNRFVSKPQQAAPVRMIENKPLIQPARTGTTFEEDLYVSLETHPTLIDHSLVKQPSYWKCAEDLNPVIPMTMTFELLAEAAHRQDPTKKIVKIGPISVFQWMEVHTPFIQKIEGIWKSEEIVSVGIKNYATGEVTLQNTFPQPELYYEGEIDLGENIVQLPSIEEIYDKYMFHGPDYQGIENVLNVTDKGIRTLIRKQKGKGSLLDNMGQTYGLYMHLTLDRNYVTFPVRVHDITFYQDMYDQEGLFECTCIQKSMVDDFTVCEMVLKREGKLWCRIKEWQNRRFDFDDLLWKVTLNPKRNLMARQIAPGVFYFDSVYNHASVWGFLRKRYLNQPEKKHYDSLPLNKRKDYLISRIVLKDSLRSYVQDEKDKITYPIEYFIRYDSNGKPYVYGVDEIEGMEISLAHKGSNAVSIVSEKPVGIDIETIEERSTDFMELSYTPQELDLMKGHDLAEWSTRFWVAKEAYGKMLGLGLQGNPKRYEVKRILDDKTVLIEDCKVQTLIYNNFIIGWTN